MHFLCIPCAKSISFVFYLNCCHNLLMHFASVLPFKSVLYPAGQVIFVKCSYNHVTLLHAVLRCFSISLWKITKSFSQPTLCCDYTCLCFVLPLDYELSESGDYALLSFLFPKASSRAAHILVGVSCMPVIWFYQIELILSTSSFSN